MGMYLNLGNSGFQSIRKSLYIDKSGLISFINKTLGTSAKLTCVSRPRRFGKSYAAQMLCAYYDKSCASEELFDDLEIAKDASYKKYLNQYDVVYLDITWFISICETEPLPAKAGRFGVLLKQPEAVSAQSYRLPIYVDPISKLSEFVFSCKS